MLILRFSWTIVRQRDIVIWKPPSPTTTQTSDSGHATSRRQSAGQGEAHRSKTAGCDEGTRLLVLVVLGFPASRCWPTSVTTIVLRRVFRATIVDHVRRIEMAVVGQVLNVAVRGLAFQAIDEIEPLAAIDGLDLW